MVILHTRTAEEVGHNRIEQNGDHKPLIEAEPPENGRLPQAIRKIMGREHLFVGKLKNRF